MQFKITKFATVLIASGIISLPIAAHANDSTELEELRALVQQLDQKVKILARNGELAEEKAAEDKKSTPIVTTGADGFGFKSADGKNAISLNGRVQAEYRAYGKSDVQNADSFDLRRAYLTVQGKVYGDYDFKVTGDFAQQSNDASGLKTTKTILDEAYFGINLIPQAKLRFGQFNMPFGLENYTSDLFNDFTERAVTEALTPSKERGAMVHGNLTKGVYYGLALSTGRGKNANNTDTQVDNPEVIGRATVNLAQFANIDDTIFHVGGSFSNGSITDNQATNSNTLTNNTFIAGQGNASSQTEGRGITFFTPSGFGGAAGDSVERTRLGAEAALAIGSIKLQTEYITHNYKGNTAGLVGTGLAGYKAGSFNKDIDAFYVSANWLVTGESYADSYLADGTWGRIKPKHNFSLADGNLGAVVLGLRYSKYDAADFAYGTGAGQVATGTATGEHAWTAAATWILNPNTRLAINYIDSRFEGGYIAVKNDIGGTGVNATGEKALTLRGQYDF
jgi:phosphate-selective porin OprO/OprP